MVFQERLDVHVTALFAFGFNGIMYDVIHTLKVNADQNSSAIM
jgi:hypothetical protein